MASAEQRIAGLILAAGFSTRAGAFKPLLPFGATTVIESSISSLRAGGVQEIVAVTGHNAGALRPVLACHGVREVVNPNPEAGMFSSVLCGAAAMGESIDAVLILPADMPLVTPSTVIAVIADFSKGGADVVYPIFDGRRGHPPIISRRCFKSSLPADLPGGLRTLLQEFEATTREVAVQDEGILIDIDTPEEYRTAVSACKTSGEDAAQ